MSIFIATVNNARFLGDTERFAGTCYKAANWRYRGQTQGRGKLGPAGKRSTSIKDLCLYPLDSDFQRLLRLD